MLPYCLKTFLISKDESGNCLEFVAMNKCSLVNSNVSHCYQKVNEYSSFKSTNGKAVPLQYKKVTKRLALNVGFTLSHPHIHVVSLLPSQT